MLVKLLICIRPLQVDCEVGKPRVNYRETITRR